MKTLISESRCLVASSHASFSGYLRLSSVRFSMHVQSPFNQMLRQYLKYGITSQYIA